MYFYHDAWKLETLISKLKDLERYNDQIALGNDAKRNRPKLVEEIDELYRQLAEDAEHDIEY